MAGDVLGLQVAPSSAFKELEEHAKRGEELHSKRARGEAGIRQFQSDVTRWTNQAEGLMRSLYLADAPGFLRWRELLDADRASPAPDDLKALEEQIHDELAERVDLLTSLMTEIRLRHDASAAPPDVEQHADDAPTYQLPDEVRALLSYALAICSGRGSREVVGLDVVLAALSRDSSQRPSDPSAATYQLTAALPQQPPPQARVEAALSSLGVDTAAEAFQRTIDPVAEAALDTALAAADAMRSEVGGGWLWSHHVVGSALVQLDLPQPVVAALGATADDLRRALREGIAQRWPDEDQSAWDRLLGPADAVLAMHEQARQRLELAVALNASRGGTAPDDTDVLVALLAGPSGERLLTALLDPDDDDQGRPWLVEAMLERYGPQAPTTGGQVADPTLRSLTVVHRATAVARATTGQPTVEIEHLLAVAVTGDVAADVLDHLGIDNLTLRERALAWILESVPPDAAERWTAMMTAPPAELSGIFASDRVRWGRRSTEADDQPLVDHLGVDVYVTMLATLIARRSTPMPVSIGLFGEWGSGKSYFMELVRQKVADLAADAAADANSPYYDDVLQMTFNAWHYSDTNLWASLAFEFFEQLGGKGSVDELTMRREEVQKELSKAQQVHADLELSKQRATAQTTALRGELADATREREQQTALFDRRILEALAADKNIKEQVERLAGDIGLQSTDGVAVLRLAQDVAATGDDVVATRKVLAHKRLWIPFTLLVLAVGLVGLALAMGDDVIRWLRGGAVLATTAFVADIGVVVGRSRRAVGELRGLAARAAEVRDTVIRGSEDVLALETKLRAAEAAETVAGARLDEVVGLIGELDRQLVELSPDRNLYRFLAERSTAYQNQLGIVSLLRRDFESLVSLIREWRTEWDQQEQHDEKRKPIDRIVLYIDDLDRCEPEQVVTVLQAVHLLLAMDLFVVVVGVDPRWLLRSLRRRYRRVLGASGKGDREAGFRESTPQNYLEKIFQVPFVLPSMDDRGFAGLLDHLTKPGAPEDGRGEVGSHQPEGPTVEARPDATTLVEPASPPRTATMTAQPRSEVAAVVLGTSQPVATPISKVELELLATLSGLVRTPRAATRLVNIYGMLRSTRDLTEGGSFLDRPGRPGDYQAVVQLLGILSGAPELLGPLLWGRLASGAVEHHALCRTNPPKTWRVFVEQLSPREANGSWCNAVADQLSADEVEAWRVLVDELGRLHEHAALDDIEPFRKWGPLVARFSFLLSAFANDEPDLVTIADA